VSGDPLRYVPAGIRAKRMLTAPPRSMLTSPVARDVLEIGTYGLTTGFFENSLSPGIV